MYSGYFYLLIVLDLKKEIPGMMGVCIVKAISNPHKNTRLRELSK